MLKKTNISNYKFRAFVKPNGFLEYVTSWLSVHCWSTEAISCGGNARDTRFDRWRHRRMELPQLEGD